MSDHKDWATPENLYRAADNADAAGFTEYGWKLQGSAERIESLWAEVEYLQRELAEKHDEVLALEAAAITPEMRERMKGALKSLDALPVQSRKRTPLEDFSRSIFRDLLGEQG